jgi:hypothetical protein
LPNDQAAPAEVFTRLSTHGQVLVIVDQPASIGALAVAVARSLGIGVAYRQPVRILVRRRIQGLSGWAGR